MNIHEIHPLNIEFSAFQAIQTKLVGKVNIENTSLDKIITSCAGVDLAYWEEDGIEWGVCSIIVIDYKTRKIIENVTSIGEITVPYIPGYLAFRELPLIIAAAKKLSSIPDVFMFDGNGMLHPRRMGIATHASFFLNKPTIGIAKSYFKMDGVNFKMPENRAGSFEDIIIDNEILGRVLRTHANVKPIFISCGNYIDLSTVTEITLTLINQESRIPIPVRLADLESKILKRNAYTK